MKHKMSAAQRLAAVARRGVRWRRPVAAQEVTFKDPIGDDNGPGTYTYPTDAVYKAGLVRPHVVRAEGARATRSTFDGRRQLARSRTRGAWARGFAVQMVFIFIDTDDQAGSGFTDGLPGPERAVRPR